MKILHVWDLAGVSGILAKNQRKLGHTVRIIKRKVGSGYNWGLNKVYGVELITCRARAWYLYVIKESRKYDIVHYHSPRKYALLSLPFIHTPLIVHFHGTDLRQPQVNIRLLRRLRPFTSIKKILVATPDLVCVLPEATWIPTPIDMDLFYPHTPRKEALSPPLDHRDMPDYLIQKGLHVQKQEKIWALSKTSLEALAVGIPVRWNGILLNPPLPEFHEGPNVTKKVLTIYQEALTS